MLPRSSVSNFYRPVLAALIACSANLTATAQETKKTDSAATQSSQGDSKEKSASDKPVTKQVGSDANRFRMQGQSGVWSDLPRPDATWAAEAQKKDRKPVWNLTQAEQDKILQTRVKTASMLGSFYEFNNLLYTMGGGAPFLMTTSPEVAKSRLHSNFVCEYLPTYGEFFESMARQTGTTIKYDPTFISKWIAAPPAMPLPYSLKMAADWQSEDRNDYVAYHPRIQPVGMDVYMFGRYSGLTPEKTRAVRDAYALNFATHIDPAIKITSMKEVKVDGCDAIFWETQSPVRPNTTWRQWSFVKNGESFTIVSALDNKNADILWPQVQEMVASFHVTEPPPASPSL